MERRTFLLSGGAAILGLRFVRFQDSKPTWFDEGLKRIKELDLPGIVVVVPDATIEVKGGGFTTWSENPEFIRWSDALEARLKSADPDVAESFVGAVWICLRESDAKKTFEKPATLMRIDADGKIVERSAAVQESFESDEAFVKAARTLIDNDFDARVQRAWKKVKDADAVKKNFANLGSDNPDVREAASKALAKDVRALVPIVIAVRRDAQDPEVKGRCAMLLHEFVASFKDRGPALPFGTQWVEAIGGCSNDPRMEGELVPTIACGMAVVQEAPKKLLRILALSKDK